MTTIEVNASVRVGIRLPLRELPGHVTYDVRKAAYVASYCPACWEAPHEEGVCPNAHPGER